MDMYLVAFGGELTLSTFFISAISKQDAVYQAVVMAEMDNPEEFKYLTFEQQQDAFYHPKSYFYRATHKGFK